MKKDFFLFIILVLVILSSSCSLMDTSATQKLSPLVYYRSDICFTYKIPKKTRNIEDYLSRFSNSTYRKRRFKRDEVRFCGVGVLPYSENYEVKIEAYDKLNFFSLTTCHEEMTSEKRDQGFFKKDGQTRVTYTPTIERGKSCVLYVAAYSKKQKHSSGIIILEDPRYKLNATLYCNGYVMKTRGVSACQTKEGLIQKITFSEEVLPFKKVTQGQAKRKRDCPSLFEDVSKEYEFKLPNRECIYGFRGVESGKIHMLNTIGHEDIIIRE